MFVRVKPSSWASGEQLTSAQMNALDIDHERSIDGYAGGTYSPLAVIEIAGLAGLLVSSTLETSGSVILGNGFLSAGGTFVSGALTINSGATYAISGNGTFSGNNTFQTGSTTFSNGFAANAFTTFSERIFLTSHAYIMEREFAGSDANTSINPSDCDYVLVDVGVLSTGRNYTFTKNANTIGAKMRIVNLDTTNVINVKNSGGTTIATVRCSAGAGQYERSVTIQHSALYDEWIVVDGNLK